MTTIYIIHTNEGTYYCSRKPSREEHMAYVRAKLQQGRSLSDIRYCWGPIHVRNVPPKGESNV